MKTPLFIVLALGLILTESTSRAVMQPGDEPKPIPGCDRVVSVSLHTLCVIAETTRKPEILFVVASTGCSWSDVLYLENLHGVTLRGQTISATVLGCGSDAGYHHPRDSSAGHGSSGGLSLRRTASARA